MTRRRKRAALRIRAGAVRRRGRFRLSRHNLGRHKAGRAVHTGFRPVIGNIIVIADQDIPRVGIKKDIAKRDIPVAVALPAERGIFSWSVINKLYALKWYYKNTATKNQKEILDNLIQSGAPDDSFLWPIIPCGECRYLAFSACENSTSWRPVL